MKIFRLTALILVIISGIGYASTITTFLPNSNSLQWKDSEALPPGAKVAILSGDPKKHETFVARIKMPANYSIPAHMHPITEYDTVLSGKLYLGTGSDMKQSKGIELPTGGFFKIPAGTMHYAWTKNETVLQITGVGPWGMIYSKSKN